MMQENYTSAEYFTLPSKGKVYTDKVVNPEIKLRSMTTLEEMRRLSPTDKPYQNLCSIIDDCRVEGAEGLSSYDMCFGDYQFLLYKLRSVTYGSEYEGQCTCPICGTLNKGKFSIDDLPVKYYTEEVEKQREFTLPSSGMKIRLKLKTPRVLDSIQSKIKEYKAKTTTFDSTILYSIKSSIEKIDDAAPDPVYFEQQIKELPMRDTNLILKKSDKLDGMIGLDTTLIYTCENCGLPFTSKLKTDNEFFRPSLDL